MPVACTMDYFTVRAVHVGCAAISIGLFSFRAALQFGGIDWRRWQWLRIGPHVNDSLLLGAAIALTTMSARYPFVQPWLTAKVCALRVYVVLGRIALARDVALRKRCIALAGAILSVGYIVAVALTRSASPGACCSAVVGTR
jgi:uncharacterized membrane protein SirB2